MAFSSTVTKVIPVAPGRRFAHGTWTNGARGDSGGDINTGLKFVAHGNANVVDSHFGAEVQKTTLNSGSAGQIRIVTSTRQGENMTGTWMAWGL